MIYKAMQINNKKVLEEIYFDEALKLKSKKDLIFTDEEEEERFDEALKEIKNKGLNFNINEVFNKKDFKRSIERLKNKVNNAFNKNDDSDEVDDLTKLFPFLDDKDIHDIVDKIIAGNDDKYKKIKLEKIAPFMNEEDIDRLFVYLFTKGDENTLKHLKKIAPFVSEDALSEITDVYIQGGYENIDIDSLYPFMDSKDIKKIFEYRLNK